MRFGRLFGWNKSAACAASVLLLGASLAGCSHNGNEQGADDTTKGTSTPASPAAAAAAAAVPKVKYATVKTVPWHLTREWPAEIKSPDSIEVSARVEGNLESFNFKEGYGVRKGQVLFTIDNAPYLAKLQSAEAQVAQARANLSFARSQVNVRKAEADLASQVANLNRCQQDVDRYQPLAHKGIISMQTLDNALAQLEVAQAQVDAAKATLRNTKLSDQANIEMCEAQLQSALAGVTQAKLDVGYCVITSPIDGVIGKLNVDPGNLVGQAGNNTPLVVISSLKEMYVDFNVSESDYLWMMQHRDDGHGAIFTMKLADGTKYPQEGKFKMLERAINSKSGTMGVRLIFPNPTFVLREGQYSRVQFSSRDSVPVLAVPEKAVLLTQSVHSVYVIGHDNKVESRQIETAETVGSNVIVTSGLKVGERIVVDGLQKVKPGVTVQAEPEQSAPVDSEPDAKA